MGIRYGRLSPGSNEVEWAFVSHCDCDGIGGLVRLLRERGEVIRSLPETRNPCRGVTGPLWRLLRTALTDEKCAGRADWARSETGGAEISKMLAWHLFTEEETRSIRERCRRDQVTVNSLLLKHLDQAIRPEIRSPQARISWMIPVNLRGDVRHADDTENHVSCVEARIAADDSPEMIQQQIHRRLERGEHRANHLLFQAGRFLSHDAKVRYLKKDRSGAAGSIGAFSNLGVWDPKMALETRDSWLFCPPVVTGQLLGAGCVTFQNRLGLTIDGYSSAFSTPDLAEQRMSRWLNGIR